MATLEAITMPCHRPLSHKLLAYWRKLLCDGKLPLALYDPVSKHNPTTSPSHIVAPYLMIFQALATYVISSS